VPAAPTFACEQGAARRSYPFQWPNLKTAVIYYHYVHWQTRLVTGARLMIGARRGGHGGFCADPPIPGQGRFLRA